MRYLTVIAIALIPFATARVALAQEARASVPPPPQAQAMLDEFGRLVEAGKGEAVIDWINAHGSSFAERDRQDPAWATKHRQSFQRYLASGGALEGHAAMVERVVADRLVHVAYAVWGADRPLVIGITLYRRGNGSWTVTGWSFGANPESLFDPSWQEKH